MVNRQASAAPEPDVAHAELPKRQVKWCAVPLSDVAKGDKRLDASFYNIQGRQARGAIKKCRYASRPLCGTGLADAYTCGRFKRVWLTFSALPIFLPSSITDIKPQPDGYLSRITKADTDELRVKKNQILITCSGSIGKIALVSRTLNNQIFQP
jgi:type I restriction enzyme S subunit